MTAELDGALKTIVEAIECHKGCEVKRVQLKKQIEDCNSNTVEMRKEMESKFEQLKISSGQIFKDELQIHKNRLATYSNDLLRQNNSIEEQLKKVQEENVELKRQVDWVIKTRSNETLEADLLERQTNVSRMQYNVLQTQNKVLQTQNDELQTQNNMLRKENNSLSERVSNLEKEIVSIKARLVGEDVK